MHAYRAQKEIRLQGSGFRLEVSGITGGKNSKVEISYHLLNLTICAAYKS